MPAQPGLETVRTATPREIMKGSSGVGWLTQNIVIDATFARDPGNTDTVEILRGGMVLGQITSGGLYAPSIIGVTGEALDGAETALTVAAPVVTELVRRVGATGTFTITGPPTAAGTVRTMTATYSAAVGTTITMTALGVADVQTLTLAAGTDGGTFVVEYKGNLTAGLAWNIAAANLQTALRALHAELALVTVGLVGEIYTVTNPNNVASSGPLVALTIVNDLTTDGGVFEGGIIVAHSAIGVNGEFVTGSIIGGTDGSQTPKFLLGDMYGLRMVNPERVDTDQQTSLIPLAGLVQTANIVNYPADASSRAWLKAQLRAVTPGLAFDDDTD